MKIKEYNQMIGYLTRPSKSTDPTQVEKDLSQNQLEKYATQPNYGGKLWKAFVSDNEAQEKIEKQKLSNIEKYNKYFNDGVAKNKTPLATEKNNIVIAMSESPTEEYELQLGIELKQFEEWLKKNKNGTYKEYLKDKTAMLTDEQKKDPKIIDLEPYLPNFEDVIKKYEKEKEEESLNDFIKRRSNEMRLAEADSFGVPTLFKKRL
ncbi:MAG: hypothetical protein H8E55_49800 [Pelagibacterales bacterium]|nr:hypothetical protein [Pelagibacterales bacterium]